MERQLQRFFFFFNGRVPRTSSCFSFTHVKKKKGKEIKSRSFSRKPEISFEPNLLLTTAPFKQMTFRNQSTRIEEGKTKTTYIYLYIYIYVYLYLYIYNNNTNPRSNEKKKKEKATRRVAVRYVDLSCFFLSRVLTMHF